MNKVTEFKFWLAGGSLVFVFLFLAAVVFFSNIGGEIKAAVVTFFITVPGTLIIQYYFRKAGSNEGGSDITPILPKADAPTITPTGGKVAGIGSCAPNQTASSAEDWPPFTIPEEPEGSEKVDGIIADIIEEAAADGIPGDVAYVSSHIVSYLGAHADELTDEEEAELIDAGLNYAKTAYTEVTGLKKIPTTYAEVAAPQTWWLKNKVACKAPAGQAKAVMMTLRDLLKRKEALA